jgi:GntR family transcriptional regulator
MMAKKSTAKGDNRPLYQKTADTLGVLLAKSAPGTFLPSEPELAQQLGVSRSTLREAMRLYEARGLVIRRRGVGTFIAKPPQVIETGLEVLSSIETLAAQIGVALESTELAVVVRPAGTEDGQQLGVPATSRVTELSRVILADGRPVGYLVDCLPQDVLQPDDIGTDFSGSVLALLIRRGDLHLNRSRAEITAIPAEPDIAEALHIHPGDVLLYLEARLYNDSDRVIDHSRSYFLPGTFRFHIVRRVQQALA